MPETEKQEGQKTVVAFIAGLLIGGLLVWVFSSSPEDAALTNGSAENDEVAMTDTDDTLPASTNTQTRTSRTDTSSASAADAQGDGELAVSDQAAGTLVSLNDVTYPSMEGWIVVRDYENGAAGLILGAARYNEEVGLTPDSVKLLRGTEAGSMYQVVFYSEDGDLAFDTESDMQIEGTATATFTAQ